MKRIYFILAGISLILFMSCARSEKGTKDTQTVKIDTVVSAQQSDCPPVPRKSESCAGYQPGFPCERDNP